MGNGAEVQGGGPGTGVIKWAGIILMVLGAIAILVPTLASWTVTVVVGWVLVAASVFLFASAFSNRSGFRLFAGIIWALLALLAGLWLLIDPVRGAKTLTYIVAIYFLVSGIFKLGVSVGNRGNPGIGWLAVNGLMSLAIGLIILAVSPSESSWVIGLLVGIDFIFSGWGLINFASAASRLEGRA